MRKDCAFTVVQAWFNCEATNARESYMKCEMTTDIRGIEWSAFGEPISRTRKDPRHHGTHKGNPQRIIFVYYQIRFLLPRQTSACVSKVPS